MSITTFPNYYTVTNNNKITFKKGIYFISAELAYQYNNINVSTSLAVDDDNPVSLLDVARDNS